MAFGDSIMEAFRGQSLGMPAGEAYAGNRAAWDKAMEGRKWVLGGGWLGMRQAWPGSRPGKAGPIHELTISLLAC